MRHVDFIFAPGPWVETGTSGSPRATFGHCYAIQASEGINRFVSRLHWCFRDGSFPVPFHQALSAFGAGLARFWFFVNVVFGTVGAGVGEASARQFAMRRRLTTTSPVY
jgi:hypothetical protein